MSARRTALALSAFLAVSPVVAAQPEPIPVPPNPVEAPAAGERVRMELVTGGYQFQLPRPAAEKVRDFLTDKVDADALAKLLTALQKDENTGAATALVAGVLAKDVPAFKKDLTEKMGEAGVTVRVYGVRRGKDRPKLRMIAQALPEPARDKVQKGVTLLKTVPLHWTVTPRDAAVPSEAPQPKFEQAPAPLPVGPKG
jgi:hypothetical protein